MPRRVELLACCVFACLPDLAIAQSKNVSAPTDGRRDHLYSIAPLRTDLSPKEKVGKRRAGFICGPAGDLTWGDLEIGREQTTILLGAGLSQSGLKVFTPNEAEAEARVSRGDRRIFGRVIELHVNACTPQWGVLGSLSGRRTWKGSGVIRIAWNVFEPGTQRKVADFETSSSFISPPDEPSLPALYERAIASAARDLAEQIASSRRDEALTSLR